MTHRAFLRVPLRAVLVLAALMALAPAAVQAQQTITQYTQGMEPRDGYVPLYWDAAKGRLLLEVPRERLGEEFLYLTSLATGLGSNRVGLDRGMVVDELIARFERAGPRVLLVLTNPAFQARDTENRALARSVDESFPLSTAASFEVVAEEGGRLLVDATAYFLDDVADVAGRLRQANQGSFRVDRARSTIYLPRTKAFPENTEIEAALTFVSDNPGPEVRRHSPDGRAITLREHHSFVKLPPPGYRPRKFDPRIGLFPVSFYDYAKSLDQDPVTRFAVRHRLIKRDPNAAMSEPVEPIVYYLDPAVPEPYRAAFGEGASWWNQVFEAAGFRNAFRIEDMPPDMDPLDARYNVIQWVHRTEAGSSWGSSFRDPRTGEIIKAAVRMDSHRSLVNYNLFMGTVPAAAGEADGAGTAGAWRAAGAEAALHTAWHPRCDAPLPVDDALLDWLAGLDPQVSAEEFAMARRRQHAAHEVGHTLGLAHNFIAASYGRASVMDYPAPLIELVDGRIDLSDAYRPGPGAYDSIAIRWAYTRFPEGEEEAGLEAIVQEAMRTGIRFITNPDEGSAGSYPEATTWTNGADPVEELARLMEVRRVLVDRFDQTALRPGEPLWRLSERFVPVYLHHRYTLGAAVKAIGGMEFRYALRGDPQSPTRIVDPARQRRALDLLLRALEPREIAVPERVLALMAPRPFGYAPDRRAFTSAAEPAFDQIGIARILASMILGGIVEPQRAARLVAFADRVPDAPTLEEVIGTLVERTWGAAPAQEHAALQRVVQRGVVDELIRLATNPRATADARAGAEWGLRRIAQRASTRPPANPAEEAHRALALADIERFLERREAPVARSEALEPPPASPIGSVR